ncbi:MAG: GNAT family protein, partial [Bacteroidales bacterium]
DMEVWKVSNTLTPFSKYTLEEFIKTSMEDIYTSKQLRLMIEEKNSQKTVGIIDVFEFDPYHQRAGIGILMDCPARNKGYAQEAISLLIHYLFHVLKLHQIYCNVLIDNEKSLHIFQKAGFKIAGLKKDWILTDDGYKDEYLLQLIRVEK